MPPFIFYQTGLSPHMAYLARALAARGNGAAYVSALKVAADRAKMGWKISDMAGVRLVELPHDRSAESIPRQFSRDAIHLTQGICRNGRVQLILPTLRQHHLRWGAMMETVDDEGFRGKLKRLDYMRRLRWGRVRPDFILATGEKTPAWLAARGFPSDRIFPFTYFLEPIDPPAAPLAQNSEIIQIGFTAQLIYLKRLDILIEALARLDRSDVRLRVIGNGPLKETLHKLALERLGADRIDWVGQQAISAARESMRSLDLFVLPSRHDGWGAVVSEALLAGTPAICSDACGASEAVHASGLGGVFRKNDVDALCEVLRRAIDDVPRTRALRPQIAAWANSSFSIQAGAKYLEALAAHLYGGACRPLPPWRACRPDFEWSVEAT